MADTGRTRRYQWSGFSQNGAQLNGDINATSEVRARVELRRRGITPTRIQRPWGMTPRIPDKIVTLVLRQMATLIHAGIPLLSALEVLAKGQEFAAMNRVLLDMRTDLQMGRSLAQSMQQHPDLFDALTCALVSAGEQAGLLDVMLERIAIYREKMLAIRGRVRSALAYPVAILGIAFIVTILMLTLVVPAFESTFSSFGATLPWATRLLLDGAQTLQTYGLSMLALSGGLIWLLYHRWSKNSVWQTQTDRWLLRLPGIGRLLQQAALARWSQTLCSLIGAGIPVLDALLPAGQSAGNRSFAMASQKIHRQLQQGVSLSASLQSHAVFSPLVVQMVAVGEESGALDQMLNKVAGIYEQEVSDTVSMLGNLLEPLLMVILGLLIGGMVIAMYLPIFQLGNVL
jgi:type IV pilus assembly protein PilC